VREIAEEGSSVTASLVKDSLELGITPSITTYDDHANKRLAASVYYEIAAKYAEKIGGQVVQRAPVFGCKDTPEPMELLLARYPDIHLGFERICPGFRLVLLGDHAHELPDLSLPLLHHAL
jgi:hypothetical protein